MNLASESAKLWNCLRSHGGAETLCRLLHRLKVASVKHSLDIYVRDIDRPAAAGPRVPSLPESCRMREVFPFELHRIRFGMDGIPGNTVTRSETMVCSTSVT